MSAGPDLSLPIGITLSLLLWLGGRALPVAVLARTRGDPLWLLALVPFSDAVVLSRLAGAVRIVLVIYAISLGAALVFVALVMIEQAPGSGGWDVDRSRLRLVRVDLIEVGLTW